MASTYLSRTFGTATSRFTCTISMWIKRSEIGNHIVWNSFLTSNPANYRLQLYFDSSDRLNVLNVDNTVNNILVTTTRKFRDLSGWYHLYFALKSSEATASDRVKIYVNGVRETAFDNATYQSTSNDMSYGAPTYSLNIGRYGGGSNYFPGLMSHCYFIDGSIVDVSQFGSTDANGVWKINTSPTISSYGNEGYFILKDGNSVTDQSGNGNNFTVGGGTLTNTEDNPSNVFATLNPLDNQMSNFTFANGNTSVTTAQAGYRYARSTLGMTAGKYYFEVKNVSHPANPDGDHYNRIGITDTGVLGSSDQLGKGAYDYSLVEVDGKVENNNTTTAYGVSYSTDGDIVGCALDLDNSKIYWHKNGTWMNSANPSAGTGGYSITPVANTGTGAYFFGVGEGGNNLSSYFNVNFGNGYFGTTAVASAGTNASGNGIFEYDVPTGFTALSTKGLNL